MVIHLRTLVKVCCIASVEEMRMAAELGADAIGLVSAMPSGPGVLDDGTIARIAAAVPPGLRAFLLTSRTDPEAIAEQVRRAGVDTVQIVAALPPGGLRDLKRLLPDVSLVQVVHVTGVSSISEAVETAKDADEILLDSGNPSAAVPELGGTGRVHDWSLSRRIRDAVDVPVWLAGGLTPENVADAIRDVQPCGVDVCSGLRTEGRLDPAKLRRFLSAIA
jgi:phosphoribosylanthranilate isomerase